ncbi:MAG: 50S ribosomal protein L4 [Methylococcales bacterium]
MSVEIPSININGDVGSVAVSEDVFGCDYNEALVHQLVTSFLSNGRSGTKAQKSRSEVAGGGAKPWRQKGSGNARAGTSRSPIWRSGGKTFASKPRSYEKKLNKKMYKAGMRSIFSELVRQNRVFIYEDLLPTEPRTKVIIEKLKAYDASSVLIITEEHDQNLELATRNICTVDVKSVTTTDPASLVRHKKIIASQKAIKLFEEQLA